MQHHQRSGNGRYIYRKHDRSILRKTQTKVIRRDDIHKIRDNEWQTGGIRNKPRGITKASVVSLLNPSASSITITIGVRISATPSLANSAATAAPSKTIHVNNNDPRPLPQRETCSAAHSKKPDSSYSGSVDTYVHHPQPVLGGKSLAGIR